MPAILSAGSCSHSRNPWWPSGWRRSNKEGWVAILRASGMSDEDMGRWHVEFERLSPEAHQDFLESLGLEDDEIARIRAWSRDPEEGDAASH